MGLFSSETITTVGTSISRVVADKNVVDSTKLAIVEALYTDGDVVDHILESAVTNIGFRAEQMYSAAETNYPYGLPSGEMYSITQGKPELQAILDGIEGQPVLIEYNRLGALNGIHYGWMQLIAQHGYNPETNQLGVLSALKNKTVYLKDMVFIVPLSRKATYPIGALQTWDKPPSAGYIPQRRVDYGLFSEMYYAPSPVEYHAGTEQLRVIATWEEVVQYTSSEGNYNVTEYKEETFYIPVPIADPEAQFFHVKYSVGTTSKYWAYEFGSGTYPQLDNLFVGAPVVSGSYFPNIYFRLNKTNPNNNQTTPEYLASKKLLKKLGMDYTSLVDSIHENPDIGDVQQAFMTMAVPADTADQVEAEYLYDYFDRLNDNGGGIASGNYLNDYLNRFVFGFYSVEDVQASTFAIEIKDGATKNYLVHDGIIKTRKTGKIAEVGECTSGNGEFLIKQDIIELNDSGLTQQIERNIKYRFYRKQVSLNFYDEIAVVNLHMKYFVEGKHHTVIGDQDKEVCLVPLDKTITSHYALNKREYLYTRSLHFVFNSLVRTKLAWYEQGWFADLVQGIGILLTVVSFGADGGFFASIGASVATAMGAYAVASSLILSGLLGYIVVSYTMKLFVETVGIEVAFVAALVAAAYGISDGLKEGAMKLTATAKEFLSLANGLIDAAQAELGSMYTDLMGDYKAFDVEKETKIKLLEDANELLDVTSLLSPLVIMGEIPGDYYKRTVHSGNIGTLLLDDVHNFHSRSLTLPSFSSSIGGFNYV